MEKSRIVTGPTAVSQWQQLLSDAQSHAEIKLDEQNEAYLVFLLMRFMSETRVAGRVVALEYLQGLLAGGQIQRDKLREVGDICLLISGLFPDRAQRRRVKLSYFINMGRAAYQSLGESVEKGLSELYTQLAVGFIQLMDTLRAVRDLDGPVDQSAQLLTALELWQSTDSRWARQTVKRSLGEDAESRCFISPYPDSLH